MLLTLKNPNILFFGGVPVSKHEFYDAACSFLMFLWSSLGLLSMKSAVKILLN